MNHTVAVMREKHSAYPLCPPYHPPEHYPERAFDTPLDPTNTVYTMVRDGFLRLAYDMHNAGTAAWNPLGHIVQPGQTIFVKPNMIAHKHALCDDWEHVITHGSVIRAVVDYIYLALKGNGIIIIGDGPQTDSHYEKIVERMGLRSLQQFYEKQGFSIELVDLRNEHWVQKNGVYTETVSLTGDPRGSFMINVGKDSMFAENDGTGKRYYGAFYDTAETNRHHADGIHEYALSRSPIEADVFINIPKLKTHKKCGLTVNLKSLVGINAQKNCLPHYVFGAPETGGDQFDRASVLGTVETSLVSSAKRMLLKKIPIVQYVAQYGKKLAYMVFGSTEKVIRSGNWHGNDTVWRMCLDLNRILLYADKNGVLNPLSRKRCFSVVDGVVAMEGNGPVAGTRRDAGVIIAGEDVLSVDCTCAAIMGFDYKKLPLLFRSYDPSPFPIAVFPHSNITIVSNVRAWDCPLESIMPASTLKFKPHFGWAGYMEMDEK